MAKAKATHPLILIDGELINMTDEQFSNHSSVIKEAEQVMLSKKEEQAKKEIAISKLVALGLTEEDLRSVGL